MKEPVYANAWEKARKVLSCCSAACVQRFDPDAHWIPAANPPLIDDMEEARMVRLAGERLRAGDAPRMVVRDLLVAGARLPAVRKVLIHSSLDADSEDASVKRLNIIGWISGLIGGGFQVAERGSKQDQRKLREAADTDLADWMARFGGAETQHGPDRSGP